MDRLIEVEQMSRIEQLESQLRISKKKELQLRDSLDTWKGVSMTATLMVITFVVFMHFTTEATKDMFQLIRDTVRDDITDCVIPEAEAEAEFGNYRKCFPWLFKEEKKDENCGAGGVRSVRPSHGRQDVRR